MLFVYNLVNHQIERGNIEGLAEKIDVYYMNNRLTQDEYDRLMKALSK